MSLTKELCPIRNAAIEAPHLPALITDNQVISYLELDYLVSASCQKLHQLDVIPNQILAFIAKTSIETIVLLFALIRLKAISAPLSPRLPDVQIADALKRLGLKELFSYELPSSINPALHSFLKIEEEQRATLIFTSGSTGIAKIACHSLGNHYYSALGVLQKIQLNTSHRYLLQLPLYHVSGLGAIFRSFLAKSALVISEKPLYQAIISHRISHLSLVPTQLHRLLKEPDDLLGQLSKHLQCILVGGAPIRPTLYKEALQRKIPVIPTYAMTETCSTIGLCTTQEEVVFDVDMPFCEVKLQKDQEILVKGKTLFMGYFDLKNDLSLNLQKGWFATKDLGEMKGDKLKLIGRKDNLFISGGENIQPEEIEEALCSIVGITEAVVVPIDDLEFGKRPVAFLKTTDQILLQDVKHHLKKKLISFKVPVAFFPLPESQGIKTSRKELEALAADLLAHEEASLVEGSTAASSSTC